MIVVSLEPHTVGAEPMEQMSQHPGGAFDGPRSQFLVLEPDRDARQRGIVPRLPVREALIEIADERRGIISNYFSHSGARLIESTGFPQQHRGREIVGDQDGFEVSREEQTAGTENVVAVRVLRVAPIALEHAVRALARAVILAEYGQSCEVGGALSQPEMLVVGPGP